MKRAMLVLLTAAIVFAAGCNSGGDVTESGQLDKQKEIADATRKGGGDPAMVRD